MPKNVTSGAENHSIGDREGIPASSPPIMLSKSVSVWFHAKWGNEARGKVSKELTPHSPVGALSHQGVLCSIMALQVVLFPPFPHQGPSSLVNLKSYSLSEFEVIFIYGAPLRSQTNKSGI